MRDSIHRALEALIAKIEEVGPYDVSVYIKGIRVPYKYQVTFDADESQEVYPSLVFSVKGRHILVVHFGPDSKYAVDHPDIDLGAKFDGVALVCHIDHAEALPFYLQPMHVSAAQVDPPTYILQFPASSQPA